MIYCFCQLTSTHFNKIGSSTNKSGWFNEKDFHSLGQWIVYCFECQIKNSYFGKGKKDTHKPNELVPTFYQYLRQEYHSQLKLKGKIDEVIKNYFLQGEIKDSQNYKNKRNFLLSKCLDRLQQQQDRHEYLIEYNWLNQNIMNENYLIFKKIAEILHQQYLAYKNTKEIQIIVQNEKKQRQKKINKRKRKRVNKQNRQKDQKQNQSQSSQEEIVQKVEQITIKQIQDKKLTKKQEANQQIEKTLINKSKDKKNGKNIKQKQIANEKNRKIQQKAKQEQLTKKQKHRKIIKQRIDEYYQCFINQLILAATSCQKYKKLVYNLISSILFQILSTLDDQQNQWKLQVYGSAEAGFSIKHSDIDLVLLLSNPKLITLKQIYEVLKTRMGIIECQYIGTAQVPLITLKVDLFTIYNNSQPKIKTDLLKMTSKQYKRLQQQNQLFSVDLTLAPIDQPHSGIQNTKQLKQMVQTYPNIKYISLLLKEYLRVRGLNKPYTGGIGSYVLIVLIHAVLSKGNLLKQRQISAQIAQISEFMSNQFIPFETVISCNPKCETKADKETILNITNPKNDKLLKTSAHLINHITLQLKKLTKFQQEMEDLLAKMEIEQKKNMRNYFLKQFNNFFYQVHQ